MGVVLCERLWRVDRVCVPLLLGVEGAETVTLREAVRETPRVRDTEGVQVTVGARV